MSYDALIEADYKGALFIDYDSNKISQTTSGDVGSYRIDIDVNQIEFNYHHLFSSEHVLAYRLLNLLKNFKIIEEQNLIQILTQKVRKKGKIKFVIFNFFLFLS